jgi:uncharacterized protein YwgA
MTQFTNNDFFGILYLINKASYYFKGKTKLQKLIMLAKQEENYPFTFEFVRYHYGPFSFEIQNVISDLVRSGIIEEQAISTSLGSECNYRLTEDGHKFLNHLNEKIDQTNKEKLDELWNKYRFFGSEKIIARAKEVFGW